jgi:hypothetical protein
MHNIEFQTEIENGTIVIPDEFKQELENGDVVNVTVLKRVKRIAQAGILAQLVQHPVPINGLRSITRDELHDR